MTIYEWSHDWYDFSRASFALTSRSKTNPLTWLGGRSVYGPHAQLWMVDLTVNIKDWDNDDGQAISAFFSRLDGQAGLVRIGHVARTEPQYNRVVSPTTASFSDGSNFTDDSGFINGMIPPTCYVYSAGDAGDNNIILGGLPISTSRLLRRGDLLEVRPNGIPAEFPHLYEVMVDGNTDSSGITGVEIRPRLRQGVAAGDQVSLSYASSVFRLIDDDQGAPEVTPPRFSNSGFKLIEAVDQVP